MSSASLVESHDHHASPHALLRARRADTDALGETIAAAADRLFRETAHASTGDALAEALTPAQRRADALGLLPEAALAADVERGTAGDRYQVVLHVNTPESGDSTTESDVYDATAVPVVGPGSDAFDGALEVDHCALYVSMETSQRLACDASLVHMRHDADGAVLAVSRKTRTIPPSIRRALVARDTGCRFPGCTSRRCDAHHVEHWADGGATGLDNLLWLCRRHHRAVHEGGFRVIRGRDGVLTFLRPPRVVHVLRACLQKNPKQRLDSAQSLRLALEGAFETAAPQTTLALAAPRPVWRRALPVAAAVGVGVLLTAAAAWRLWPMAAPAPVNRFSHVVPEGQTLRNTGRPILAVSPDGRRFVYNTNNGLYLRSLDEVEARPIPGTEASLTNPFFSPEGQSIGYWQEGQLKRIAIGGGAPVVIGPAGNPIGASWSRDGAIVFAAPEGILRVPTTGGTPAVVIPAQAGEQLAHPQLLPDGETVLFTVGGGRPGSPRRRSRRASGRSWWKTAPTRVIWRPAISSTSSTMP